MTKIMKELLEKPNISPAYQLQCQNMSLSLHREDSQKNIDDPKIKKCVIHSTKVWRANDVQRCCWSTENILLFNTQHCRNKILI